MLLSYLRSQHSDWDERQILDEAARRLSHGAMLITGGRCGGCS
jgi:hypothetical protein